MPDCVVSGSGNRRAGAGKSARGGMYPRPVRRSRYRRRESRQNAGRCVLDCMVSRACNYCALTGEDAGCRVRPVPICRSRYRCALSGKNAGRDVFGFSLCRTGDC